MRSSNFLRDSNSVFFTSFSTLSDPRRTAKGHFKYPFDEILFLVISAVLCGADGWVSINTFGKLKLAWLDAAQFNTKIRQHWTIENNLHWALDVLFNEDALLMKQGNSAVNFSIINKMALALLDQEKSTKKSKPQKRLTAALDDEYRSLVLNC